MPILATVITAFRVRDLPRFEDSVKFDRIQKCDDCDVKFGNKLHSIKTESDKYKTENFKKTVKQQQVDQNFGSKFDISNENDDDLNILKGRSETKKHYPSSSKINLDASSQKIPSFSHKDVDNNNIVQKSSPPPKPALIKDTISKSVKYDVNRRKEDDEFKDDKKAVPLIPKLSSIKHVESQRTDANYKLTKSKDKSVNDNEHLDSNKKYVGPKLKLVDTKKIDRKLKEESFEVSDSRSTSKEIEEDDEDDDDDDETDQDDDDDEDDDDDDDDDGALSSLWETFSMWGLNIDPSLKPTEKKEKQLIPKIKTSKQKNDTKETFTVPAEVLLKVKETTKKLETKPVISNLREAVQKPYTKSVTPKKVQNLKKGEDNNDDVDSDDDVGNKDMPHIKYTSKNKIKKTDVSITTRKKITSIGVKTDDDDDDDEAEFKLLEDKYKFKSNQNIKKEENIKKTGKTIQDSNDDDSDEVDDDNESNDVIRKLSSASKTTSGTDDKKNIITKKTFTIENESNSADDQDDGDEDDDDEDDDDEDDDTNDSDQLLNKMSREDRKAPKKTPLSENKKEEKKETKKQVTKGDKNIKKEEMVKSDVKKKESSTLNKELKTKEYDVKSVKPLAKNDTTSNQLPKTEDTKERKESKSLNDKYKKEIDTADQAIDIKSKDKKTKAPQRSQPDTARQKPIQSGHEKEKDSEDGLNLNDIKKEIKAQIRSNQDVKKSDKSKEKIKDSAEISSSIESNLKHVTDALHRRNLLKSDFEDFYAFFPTFAPNFSRIHNPECRRHGQIVLRQLRGTKLWALNSKSYYFSTNIWLTKQFEVKLLVLFKD